MEKRRELLNMGKEWVGSICYWSKGKQRSENVFTARLLQRENQLPKSAAQTSKFIVTLVRELSIYSLHFVQNKLLPLRSAALVQSLPMLV